MIEDGRIIGYYAVRGENSIEDTLYSAIEKCEIEVRTFCIQEMKVALTLNTKYLLPVPLQISTMSGGDSRGEPKAHLEAEDLFGDILSQNDIEEARKFKEGFIRRRVDQMVHVAV